jgi:Uma2 family endonuclease
VVEDPQAGQGFRFQRHFLPRGWIEHGATLGWLIDPHEKRVYVYVPGGESSIEFGNAVRGHGPVEGFTLDLDELWRCYEV